jgi:hypothetical protein
MLQAMRFSSRLAARANRALTYEDAPRPTRIGFLKGVLPKSVGSQSGYGPRSHPLETTETHQQFIALIRDEADPWDYDSQSSWDGLATHLKDSNWMEFYDFVEMVGKLLLEKDDDIPFGQPDDFRGYQKKVNALFREDGIGWTLSDQSELHRQVPPTMAKRLKSTQAALTDKYQIARVHYQKAETYLYQHPIDEANSIKEMVSAIESVAKVIAPKTSTLGDAIKLLRNDSRFSSHLLDGLEKIYIYSNATPLIRHGHVHAGRPSLSEAEMVFFAGVAYIRYLIDVGGGETLPLKRVLSPRRG